MEANFIFFDKHLIYYVPTYIYFQNLKMSILCTSSSCLDKIQNLKNKNNNLEISINELKNQVLLKIIFYMGNQIRENINLSSIFLSSYP